jgi:succinoglycan biosynthesis transport protein ExoP
MLDTPPDTAEAARPGRRGHRLPLDTTHSAPSPITPGVLLGILRRRQWLLIASVLLIPLAAGLALHATTPRYTATGTLLYDPPAYRLAELQSILRVDPITDAVLASQAEVMRGLKIAQRVATQLNLFDNPEFNRALHPPSLPTRVMRHIAAWLAPAAVVSQADGTRGDTEQQAGRDTGSGPGDSISRGNTSLGNTSRGNTGQSDAGVGDTGEGGPVLDDTRNSVLLAVQQATTATATHDSRVITVTFTAENRVLAAAAVNMVMDIYIKDQLGAKFRAVRKASEWMDGRVKELRVQVHGDDDRIAAFRASHNMIQGMHAPLDAEAVSTLNEGLVHARADLAAAEARLDVARGRAGASALAAIAPSVVQLRAQQDGLRAQLQGLNARLGPNHPDVIDLRQQLNATERAVGAETGRVVAATAADASAARQRVATLEAGLAEARQTVDRSAQAQIPLSAMQRDADAARDLLQAMLGHIQETAQQAAIEAPDAHEVSLALPPEHPSSPRVLQVMAGASAFAVLFGLLLVYLAEIADRSLRNGAEVRATLGLPCFALIPEVTSRQLGRMPVAAYAAMKPLSQFAEQLRALRAGLWMGANRPRIVAVTAARPAEGKTSVALALGRAAAQAGERVCVLDCDVRQPSFGRLLLADGEAGLTDLLAGNATDEQVIRQDPLTGMRFIAAGSQEANAFALFMSEAMARLLQRLRAQFDLVLLDAPPAQAMTDTRVIAGIADATLLCLRWRSTPLGVAENALALLNEAGANVVGVALTRVDARVHLRSGSADAEVYHPRYGGYFRG